MNNILVTGANGQVGSAIQDLTSEFPGLQFHFFNRQELDITNQDQVNAIFNTIKPNFCINTAAYTAVDKAESDEEHAHQINVLGSKFLAKACENIQAKLIHISSDYVYHNSVNRPLLETDPTQPKSIYAQTKLDGEKQVLKFQDNIVIRTSWVYGLNGHNFIKTVIRLAAERDRLTIVDDQIGVPTNAADLAAAICSIIQFNSPSGGIYNYSPSGVSSWYDIAQHIVQSQRLDASVVAIPTRDFPTPAARPHYSVLNTKKIRKTFNLTVPYWKDSLDNFLEQLIQK